MTVSFTGTLQVSRIVGEGWKACESELSVNRREKQTGSPFSSILKKRGIWVPINIIINTNGARVTQPCGG